MERQESGMKSDPNKRQFYLLSDLDKAIVKEQHRQKLKEASIAIAAIAFALGVTWFLLWCLGGL